MPAATTPGTTPRSRQLWLIPIVLVVAAFTVAATLVTRDHYREPEALPPAPVAPTNTSVPADARPGDSIVRPLLDASAHPMYETVRTVLQGYFDAINNRDYSRWQATVTKDRISSQPEQVWRHAYQTTRDGSVVVYRIESGPPERARVLMSFISVQDPADAPPELPEDCIQWHVVFALTVEGGVWKVDTGPTALAPQHEACA